MKFISLFLLLGNLVFAQYDSTMYDLIRTTYSRSFDREIISKYLNSPDDLHIKAGILSISQSDDSSFVADLLKLNLEKYGRQVCFALAQIGPCNQSINFLWKYLHSSPPVEQFPGIFFAIGKIGTENDLKKIIEFYNAFDGPIFPYTGISEAILEFQLRGIKNDEALNILETEITNPLSAITRIGQGLFALARYRKNNLSEDQFQRLFNSAEIIDDQVCRQFLLMNINKRIHLSKKTLDEMINKDDPLTKIHLIKIFHLFDIDNSETVDDILNCYLKFLNDDNFNVAIQTAISLKNLKSVLNDSLKSKLKSEINELLFDQARSMTFKGELFLSGFDIFGAYSENTSLLNKIHVLNRYKFDFYSKNPDPDSAFSSLFKFYSTTSNVSEHIDLLPFILDLQNKVKDTSGFKHLVLNSLSGNSAPVISITADGIDSVFIRKNSNQLMDIISVQLDRIRNNPDFLEATMSLVNLSEKIDSVFFNKVMETIKISKLYSIRKFIAEKTGSKIAGQKETEQFEALWQNTFRYKQAAIETSKGEITIEFYPGIAPVSVANFCMLAAQNFYNNISFHRVVPGFVIQAGDPTATGWGGPGYDIVSEFSDSNFSIGYIGMASAGKDTEGSQFFIMQGCYPHLDSKYTLFAKVIGGMNTVYNITQDDKIINIVLK